MLSVVGLGDIIAIGPSLNRSASVAVRCRSSWWHWLDWCDVLLRDRRSLASYSRRRRHTVRHGLTASVEFLVTCFSAPCLAPNLTSVAVVCYPVDLFFLKKRFGTFLGTQNATRGTVARQTHLVFVDCTLFQTSVCPFVTRRYRVKTAIQCVSKSSTSNSSL